MKTIIRLSVTLLLVLVIAGLGNAQSLTAKIVVKGVSPELKKGGRYDAVSSGLPNVGKGQKVWLEPQARYTSSTIQNTVLDSIISYTWTLTNPPYGNASIVETDTVTYFIPDTTGQYQIDLSVTTSHGTASTTLFVNSSTWVGAGGITGRAVFPQCGLCHTDKLDTWEVTNHATAFRRKLDDSTGHFGPNCLSCHTVGFDALPTAVNNGFDDVQAATGWVFPAKLQPGNYDSLKADYPALAQLTSIQCENCHGPGGGHYGQTDKNQIAASLSADVCAQCHDSRNNHAIVYEWQQSAHAGSVTSSGGRVESKDRYPCAECHSSQGFIDVVIDGDSLAAPYNDVQSITCAGCHDPHDASHEAQLRRQSIAEACTGCHINRMSGGSGLHESHQGPMLAGSTGTPFTADKIPASGQYTIGPYGGWQLPGYKYPNSSHTDIQEKCVQCHMASVAGADTLLIPGIPYSEYRNKIGGHTFMVHWDHGTPNDESDDVINPVGCKDCHGVVTHEFVDLSQDKIKTLLETLRTKLPHRTSGDTTAPKRPFEGGLTQIQQVASYNYYFVENDGSFGVHNHNYAKALLESSIDQLDLGAGAADIASLQDVPNDQGKQVQIVWNKFPAESYGIEPVVNYLVLRADTVGSNEGTSTPTATSYREMLSKVKTGTRVILAGAVWTKVGEYKAINLPQYSLVVPTLYDSTVADGMKLTTFEVVGYTAANGVYTSAPMSGYSVDNLAPSTPSGFVAQYTSNSVHLSWDEPVDGDFNYFAVYRDVTPNFDPHATTPLTTSVGTSFVDAAVNQGTEYYYKISAVDYSGNESPYSAEVSVLVLGVGDHPQIPTEFGISQNYPNPFNPTTQIAYQLPTVSHVRIIVYNTLGMEVASIVDKDQEPGYYSVLWDGHDNVGRTVASGIYIYKMQAGTYSAVKKMIFMK